MRVLRSVILVATVLLLGGCKGDGRQDPILRLSSAEALAEGQAHMERGKYARARRYLTHAFEAEPNSVTGREALLLVADTLYLQGGSSNLIQAEAKYRDFQNRFPTSDRADYVQYQIGNSLADRSEKPDRDQSTTKEAVLAFQELIRLYPTSEYAEKAQGKYQEVRDKMAAHEWSVGYFYIRYGLPRAAVARFEFLLEEYPDYPDRERVLYHLGIAYWRSSNQEMLGQAIERLRSEYPESRWLSELESKKEGD